MPRIFLPSKQPDNSPNWVDLKSPDDFMAADLFAMHAAVKVRPGPQGEYSGLELADDRVNSFLVSAITGWSFQVPIPAQNGVAAGDVVIGRAMKAKDWSSLKRQAQPYIDELEGEDLPDPTKSGGTTGEGVPVPVEQAG